MQGDKSGQRTDQKQTGGRLGDRDSDVVDEAECGCGHGRRELKGRTFTDGLCVICQ